MTKRTITWQRGKNKKPPRNSPLSHEEWLAAQQQLGESDDAFRKRSQRERTARYRIVHRERLRLERLQDYVVNKEEIARAVARRKAANPDVYRATQRRHFERNRDAKIAKLKEWMANNPERHAAAKKAWEEANRPLLAAYSAKWRKCCRIATPAWGDFDAIKAYYVEAARLTAETGIPHEVDHIIPVQGKTVCGLHVQTNMRVIPAGDNCRKRNKLDLELLMAVYPKLHV